MSRTFTIDRSALLKIILHSLKYPTTAINGILLGKENISINKDANGGDVGANNSKSKVLHIYDAIPVTHNYIALSGPFEAALVQVEKFCDDNKDQGLEIVGYYQANERLEDTELGGIGRRYAERLDALRPGSVALVVSRSCWIVQPLY